MKKLAMLLLFGLVGCSGCAHKCSGVEGGKCAVGMEHGGNRDATCGPGLQCRWNDDSKQFECQKDEQPKLYDVVGVETLGMKKVCDYEESAAIQVGRDFKCPHPGMILKVRPEKGADWLRCACK